MHNDATQEPLLNLAPKKACGRTVPKRGGTMLSLGPLPRALSPTLE